MIVVYVLSLPHTYTYKKEETRTIFKKKMHDEAQILYSFYTNSISLK
jgi:hypothetical protein